MKTNKVWLKIHQLFTLVWSSIKDSLSMKWAGMIPSQEEDKQSDEVKTERSSGPLPNQIGQTDDVEKKTADQQQAKEALATIDELNRARARVTELEEQVKRYRVLEETEKRLLEARQENLCIGKRGRPKKTYKKITFNMYYPWAILFQVGVELQSFKQDKTVFLNQAIEEFFKHEYSDLYSLYLNSLKDETINREHHDIG